ncbi:IS66 family insertion sequence element accessory protein TnpB [Methylocystis suflitae]|uniref:IS66 family insertion sequence element accessory protein TnpB n=1 Tax=Methylocystis suflitae TaxID=2951405 RepID=UPI003899279A
MIPLPAGCRVWIATGHTDMRRGMQGLALQVQEQLKRDPHAGDLYIFRGRRGDLAKILWHRRSAMRWRARRSRCRQWPTRLAPSAWRSIPSVASSRPT